MIDQCNHMGLIVAVISSQSVFNWVKEGASTGNVLTSNCS